MAQDYLLKSMTNDGMFRAYAINATNTVEEARQRHDTYNASSEALGRSILGGVMLSTSTLEGKQSMTVKIDGGGKTGPMIVDSDANGNVKGFISHPHVELPTDKNNNIDVGKAVGTNGYIQVIKNLNNDREPYTSNVHLATGKIGDDYTYYLAQSEQIPSAMGVSVYVNPNNSIGVAGGYLIQAMPGASNEAIDRITEKIKNMQSIADLLSSGKKPEDILDLIFGKNELKSLQKMPVQFKCNCSKQRFGRDIVGLNPKDIEQMINEDHGAQVVCNFCGNHYQFNEDDLKALLVISQSKHNS